MPVLQPTHDETPVDVEPIPGPRGDRRRWTGEASSQSTSRSRRGRKSRAEDSRPFARYLPVPDEQRRQQAQQQMRGMNAGKGFALLALLATHILMPAELHTGVPSLWSALVGLATVLFCVLAGVYMVSSGTGNPGQEVPRSSVPLIVPAVLLFVVGLALNSIVDLQELNILMYLSVMFLLAIPMYKLSSRVLVVLSLVLIATMPAVRSLIHNQLDGGATYLNPALTDLVQDPAGVATTLLISGSFPAVIWVAFVCLGMAVGRMPVLRPGKPLLLVTAGLALAGCAQLISWLVLRDADGFNTTGAMSFFREPGIQPHAASSDQLVSLASLPALPWSLAIGAGLSLATLGILILLAQRLPRLLLPVINLGSAPVTIYLTHLLFFTALGEHLVGWQLFALEASFFLIWASLWRRWFVRGPLELLISSGARFFSQQIVPVAHIRPIKQVSH